MRATRRFNITIGQVVQKAWLIRYSHSQEHELNEHLVFLDKQCGVEHLDPLMDISIPLAEKNRQSGVPLEEWEYRNSPYWNTKSDKV